MLGQALELISLVKKIRGGTIRYRKRDRMFRETIQAIAKQASDESNKVCMERLEKLDTDSQERTNSIISTVESGNHDIINRVDELTLSSRKMVAILERLDSNDKGKILDFHSTAAATGSNSNVVEDGSVMTGDTGMTEESLRRRDLQMKQRERQLVIDQKKMQDAGEQERKINRLEAKRLHEKVERDLKKVQREHQTEMQKMEARSKAKDTKHTKEVATLKKELEAQLKLMEKDKENMANSNGSIFDIKPIRQEPSEPEKKAMNEHVRTTRASRARARGVK